MKETPVVTELNEYRNGLPRFRLVEKYVFLPNIIASLNKYLTY